MNLTCAELGTVDYLEALAMQQALAKSRQHNQVPDTVMLLEHPSVFTIGRGGDEKYVLDPGIAPLYRVARGGEVTYHGPGQLVVYPIINLVKQGRDVHRYLRALESVVLKVLGEWGIIASRRERFTGVWVNGKKIASIGVGVRRWVTSHGFSLNVDPNLDYFSAIVPCGIAGVKMTSMRECLQMEVSQGAVRKSIIQNFAQIFGHREIIWREKITIPPTAE